MEQDNYLFQSNYWLPSKGGTDFALFVIFSPAALRAASKILIFCQMHAFRQDAMPYPILRLQTMMGQAGCVVLCNYCRCPWQGGVICIRPLTGQTGRIMAAGRKTLWRSMQLSRGMGVMQRIHTEPNHPSSHGGAGTWKRLFHLNYIVPP